MSSVTPAQAIRYLERYIECYRKEYARFTTPLPNGGGYPKLPTSAYIDAENITCYLAKDGAVLLHESEPQGQDFNGNAWLTTPGEIRDPSNPIKSIRISDEIRKGDLGRCEKTASGSVGQTQITVKKYGLDWRELIRRLTFGVLELNLDLHLPGKDADYWQPRRVRNIGFATADGSSRRIVHYAELLRHTDLGAWDPRSAWARAHVDMRVHFAYAVVAAVKEPGGTIGIQGSEVPIGPFSDRLGALEKATSKLEILLRQPSTPESAFHQLLVDFPALLDIYGDVESKPRWRYPAGDSPTGKSYVEPDFVVSQQSETYKLVEIERADHQFATRGPGHPTAAVTHAAFQIGEWKDYINHHYDLLKSKYPNIAGNISTAIVISRSQQQQFGAAGSTRYLSIVRQQLGVDEILTWDDLLERAQRMVRQLAILHDSVRSHDDWA